MHRSSVIANRQYSAEVPWIGLLIALRNAFAAIALSGDL